MPELTHAGPPEKKTLKKKNQKIYILRKKCRFVVWYTGVALAHWNHLYTDSVAHKIAPITIQNQLKMIHNKPRISYGHFRRARFFASVGGVLFSGLQDRLAQAQDGCELPHAAYPRPGRTRDRQREKLDPRGPRAAQRRMTETMSARTPAPDLKKNLKKTLKNQIQKHLKQILKKNLKQTEWGPEKNHSWGA